MTLIQNIATYVIMILLLDWHKFLRLNTLMKFCQAGGFIIIMKHLKIEKFIIEREHWCYKHLEKKILKNYNKQLLELLTLIKAEKRILNYKCEKGFIRDIKLNNITSLKNLLFVLFSLIPIIPLIIYKLRELKFKNKWF